MQKKLTFLKKKNFILLMLELEIQMQENLSGMSILSQVLSILVYEAKIEDK